MGRGRVVQPLIRSVSPLEVSLTDSSVHRFRKQSISRDIAEPELHEPNTRMFLVEEPERSRNTYKPGQSTGVPSVPDTISARERHVLRRHEIENNQATLSKEAWHSGLNSDS